MKKRTTNVFLPQKYVCVFACFCQMHGLQTSRLNVESRYKYCAALGAHSIPGVMFGDLFWSKTVPYCSAESCCCTDRPIFFECLWVPKSIQARTRQTGETSVCIIVVFGVLFNAYRCAFRSRVFNHS